LHQPVSKPTTAKAANTANIMSSSALEVSKENRPLLPNVMASPALKRESLGTTRLTDAAVEAAVAWRLRITDILKNDASSQQPEALVQAFSDALDRDLSLETYRNHAHYVELWCLRVRHEGAGKARAHLDFMRKNSIGLRNAYYYIEQASQIISARSFARVFPLNFSLRPSLRRRKR
jgi:hypothetical protein